MNNQKDTQKTNINIYGKSDVPENNSLSSMSVYEFTNKKTEKLVTALYMVTDCMDTDDALKGKLRLLGVELLSDMYKFTTLSPMDKHIQVPVSLNHIYEVLSFIEIAYTIGFISEMNTTILRKEFNGLVAELKSHQTKDKHFTFILDEKMFDLPELPNKRQDLNYGQSIKDMSLRADKRTSSDIMSFINKKSPLQTYNTKKTNHSATNLVDREIRINKIISTIKDLPSQPGQAGKKDFSIKDISLSFTDCSEKTIQRELNSLVLKGKLRKTGAKRWSRYAIVENSK